MIETLRLDITPFRAAAREIKPRGVEKHYYFWDAGGDEFQVIPRGIRRSSDYNHLIETTNGNLIVIVEYQGRDSSLLERLLFVCETEEARAKLLKALKAVMGVNDGI